MKGEYGYNIRALKKIFKPKRDELTRGMDNIT
jgi:hypothetical protein